MSIQVNPLVSPRIITVPEGDGTVITIQSLVNQIRDWEDDQVNLCYPKLLSASGKEDLGGNVLVGITARLENARLKFADRASPTYCDVLGGNLVAVDINGDAMNPTQYSTNVTITISKSSSATLIQAAIIPEIKDSLDQLHVSVDDLKEGQWTSVEKGAVLSEIISLRQMVWNKKVLTKMSDNEYLEELFDDEGNSCIRAYQITKTGDVEVREVAQY